MIIDINRMIDESISINECLFIYFCQIKDNSLYNFYREQFGSMVNRDQVISLIEKGYLEYKDSVDRRLVFSNLEPTTKSKFILGTVTPKLAVPIETNTLDWMEEWYSLFPKGVKSGGYAVRSGLNTCRTKMFKFLKRNKISKDIIITATKLYIKNMEKQNYSYMQLAKYFIEKDGGSELESYCEQVKERLENGENLDIELNKGYSDGFNTSLN